MKKCLLALVVAGAMSAPMSAEPYIANPQHTGKPETWKRQGKRKAKKQR
jgi:hypothetical protein